MSSLSDYLKGLDDAVWTDERASELSEIPTTATWTNTRVGNLDLLAGGTGAKPNQHWRYSGLNNNWNLSTGYNDLTVSISNYENCMVFGTYGQKSRVFSVAYLTLSNTVVRAIGKTRYNNYPSYFNYVFTVSKFG